MSVGDVIFKQFVNLEELSIVPSRTKMLEEALQEVSCGRKTNR